MNRIVVALALSLAAVSAQATTVQLPEPSALGLAGIGLVAGILVWRIRRGR